MTEGVPYEMLGLIEARLNTLNLEVPVLQIANLERLPRNTPLAVILVPDGIQPDEQRRGQAVLKEDVLVIVQSRNVIAPLSGEASREQAAPLMMKVLKGLLGWTPDALRYEPLVLSGGNNAPDYEGGLGFYPLSFTTRYVVTGV